MPLSRTSALLDARGPRRTGLRECPRVASANHLCTFISWVKARLAEDGAGGARFTLAHTALLSDHWAQCPGAVGIGWEMGLLGMELRLTRPSEPKMDEATSTPMDRGLSTVLPKRGCTKSHVLCLDAQGAGHW